MSVTDVRLAFLDEYLGYLHSVRNLSERSVRAYRSDLTAFAAWLSQNGTTESEVDPSVVRRYVASLSRRNAAVASVNRALSALKGYYRFLVRTGRSDANPLESVRGLRKEKRLPGFLFEQ